MQPRIEICVEKKLVGLKMIMSLEKNRTADLWRQFMVRRQEIKNGIMGPVYSIQVYPTSYFEHFFPTTHFEKWAAVEVMKETLLPDKMETFHLSEGLYAVFDYTGLSTSSSIFEYIFTTWLPASNYLLDKRPHFEVLGEKYKNNDPESEEEIWIPIKFKQ